jgi:transcriptional regulator with XRE-family HTH domain
MTVARPALCAGSDGLRAVVRPKHIGRVARREDSDDDFRRAVGRRVLVAYLSAGMNRHEFAQRLPTTYTNVYRWEFGESAPSAAAITRIALLCRVTTDWLLGMEIPVPGDVRYVNRETAIRRGLEQNPGRWERRTLDAVRSQLLTADEDPDVAGWQAKLDVMQERFAANDAQPPVKDEPSKPSQTQKTRPNSMVQPAADKAGQNKPRRKAE